MDTTYRRPTIRIAMLIGAWCCGFLFVFFKYELTNTAYYETVNIMTYLDTFWHSISETMLQRLLDSDLSTDSKSQLAALTLGHREFLPPEIKMLYQRAGASHILALSGMHLGILYGLFNTIIRHSILTKWKWLTIPIIHALIWSFSLMTGMPKSLVRAATMASLSLTLSASGRNTKELDVLVSSMCLIFMIDPGSLFDCGFQLSCAAMTGIIVLGLPIIDKLHKSSWPIRYIGNYMAISVSAQLCTTPLVLWYFSTFATYSAITSLLTIPITVLIIYFSIGFYAGIDVFIPALELTINIQNSIMNTIGKLPGAYVNII